MLGVYEPGFGVVSCCRRHIAQGMFTRTSKKIFVYYPEYRREVSSMTELKIKTLSMQLAEKDEQLAEQKERLAEQAVELAEQAATIAKLKKQLADLQ